MRLFVGIPLADEVVGELSLVVSRLRPVAGNLRWSKPESWHITLQFLGHSTPAQLESLGTRLADVRSLPVPVQLGKLGSFERAGVFFADVVVTQELAALQERVVDGTSRCGFFAESRPFHPHITLARKAGNQGSREPGNENARSSSLTLRHLTEKPGPVRFTGFVAREFLLYESHLSSEGSRYEVRARFPLGS